MATASVASGTPGACLAWRSRAYRSSREVMRATIATATDSTRAVSTSVWRCDVRCSPRGGGARSVS